METVTGPETPLKVSVGSIQASGPLGSITISTGAVEPANGKVVVMVNGTPWIPFDGLVDPTVAVADRTQFFVQYNSNSIVIYFGNGYVLKESRILYAEIVVNNSNNLII